MLSDSMCIYLEVLVFCLFILFFFLPAAFFLHAVAIIDINSDFIFSSLYSVCVLLLLSSSSFVVAKVRMNM